MSLFVYAKLIEGAGHQKAALEVISPSGKVASRLDLEFDFTKEGTAELSLLGVGVRLEKGTNRILLRLDGKPVGVPYQLFVVQRSLE